MNNSLLIFVRRLWTDFAFKPRVHFLMKMSPLPSLLHLTSGSTLGHSAMLISAVRHSRKPLCDGRLQRLEPPHGQYYSMLQLREKMSCTLYMREVLKYFF